MKMRIAPDCRWLSFSLALVWASTSVWGCPFLKTLTLEKQGPESRRTLHLAQYQWALKQAFEQDTLQLLQEYQNGQLAPPEWNACQSASADLQNRIQYDFAPIFIKAYFKQLAESRSNRLQLFAQSALEFLQSGALVPVQIQWEPALSSPLPAGFDRQTKTTFFRLLAIPPQNFNSILVHEFSHAMDSLLKKAISDFADPALEGPAIAAIQKSARQNLSATEIAAIRRYLRAGADRGIFAEFRAWVITQAVTDPSPRALSALRQDWWESLKSGYALPKEGLFKNPTVRKIYQQMVQEIDPQAEPFGNLAIYLQ